MASVIFEHNKIKERGTIVIIMTTIKNLNKSNNKLLTNDAMSNSDKYLSSLRV